MNIYEKMLAITSELSAVAKNLSVGEGKSSYKAVGEADVLAAVKPLESKHKIYSYPLSRRVIDTNVMTTTSTYNGNTKEVQKLFMRVETVYRFVNAENPDEFLDVTTYGDGVDTQDKAPGKAMTYADKYALLKAYKIITGEDPDQNKSEEGTFEDRLATASEKKIFMDTATSLGVDAVEIAENCGVKGKMTVSQYALCMAELKKISEKK